MNTTSDIQLERAAVAIRFSALAAYHLSLSGTPDAQAAWKWFDAPRPGDMVCEMSSAFHKADHVIAVGRLTREASEPFRGDWGDEPAPMERVWYIECLDGVERRWTNAKFVRVPEAYCPWSNRD